METREKNQLSLGHQGSFCTLSHLSLRFCFFFSPPICLSYETRSPRNMFLSTQHGP